MEPVSVPVKKRPNVAATLRGLTLQLQMIVGPGSIWRSPNGLGMVLRVLVGAVLKVRGLGVALH